MNQIDVKAVILGVVVGFVLGFASITFLSPKSG